MDEMKIGSRLMKSVVAKIVRRKIKKALGYDIDLTFNELNLKIIDGTAHVHVNVDADIPKEELNKILAKKGL